MNSKPSQDTNNIEVITIDSDDEGPNYNSDYNIYRTIWEVSKADFDISNSQNTQQQQATVSNSRCARRLRKFKKSLKRKSLTKENVVENMITPIESQTEKKKRIVLKISKTKSSTFRSEVISDNTHNSPNNDNVDSMQEISEDSNVRLISTPLSAVDIILRGLVAVSPPTLDCDQNVDIEFITFYQMQFDENVSKTSKKIAELIFLSMEEKENYKKRLIHIKKITHTDLKEIEEKILKNSLELSLEKYKITFSSMFTSIVDVIMPREKSAKLQEMLFFAWLIKICVIVRHLLPEASINIASIWRETLYLLSNLGRPLPCVMECICLLNETDFLKQCLKTLGKILDKKFLDENDPEVSDTLGLIHPPNIQSLVTEHTNKLFSNPHPNFKSTLIQNEVDQDPLLKNVNQNTNKLLSNPHPNFKSTQMQNEVDQDSLLKNDNQNTNKLLSNPHPNLKSTQIQNEFDQGSLLKNVNENTNKLLSNPHPNFKTTQTQNEVDQDSLLKNFNQNTNKLLSNPHPNFKSTQTQNEVDQDPLLKNVNQNTNKLMSNPHPNFKSTQIQNEVDQDSLLKNVNENTNKLLSNPHPNFKSTQIQNEVDQDSLLKSSLKNVNQNSSCPTNNQQILHPARIDLRKLVIPKNVDIGIHQASKLLKSFSAVSSIKNSSPSVEGSGNMNCSTVSEVSPSVTLHYKPGPSNRP